MIQLDGATVLLQWSVGGLFFLWMTTRRREVGLGYGWTMRITYSVFLIAALVVSRIVGPVPVRDIATVLVLLATLGSLAVSVQRKSAGVEMQRETIDRRTARVAAMTGIDREVQRFDKNQPEFPPNLDLIAPAIGLIGLIAAGIAAGSPVWLAVLRTIIGAAFLGAITDAMLLGHWYLVQPGLARAPLLELVRWTSVLWPAELAVMLLPTGMVSVLNGTIDDNYGGILGWTWLTCAVTTAGLLLVTRAALKERQYAAVMAATGLLYLGILTAFGMDLIARAVLA